MRPSRSSNYVILILLLLPLSAFLSAQKQEETGPAALRKKLETAWRAKDYAGLRGLTKELWLRSDVEHILDPRQLEEASSLEAGLASYPSYRRFLAGCFSHENPQRRAWGARLSRSLRWPYMARLRARALARETDPKAQLAFLQTVNGRLAAEEFHAAANLKTTEPAVQDQILRTMFQLCLARCPGTQRVSAWPGAKDWTERGFNADLAERPFRSAKSSTLRIPAPLARNANHIFLAYKVAKPKGEATLLLGDTVLKTFKLKASAEAWCVEAIDLSRPELLVGADLVLKLPKSMATPFMFRGIAALEVGTLKRHPVGFELNLATLKPKSCVVAVPNRAFVPGLVIQGDQAALSFDLPVIAERIRRIDIDHWCDDDEPSVWDLELNGKPLVRLISQALPRPAKSHPRHPLVQPGRNVLVFKRVSGKTLNVETFRLFF